MSEGIEAALWGSLATMGLVVIMSPLIAWLIY